MSKSIRSPVSKNETEQALYLLSNYHGIFLQFIKMREDEPGYASIKKFIEVMQNTLENIKNISNDYFCYGNFDSETTLNLYYEILRLSFFADTETHKIMDYVSETFGIYIIPPKLSKLKRRAAEAFAYCYLERGNAFCG